MRVCLLLGLCIWGFGVKGEGRVWVGWWGCAGWWCERQRDENLYVDSCQLY